MGQYNSLYIDLFQNASFNGSLLPHLPSHGGSQNGSPDMRLAASNLSLGSQNGGPTQVGGRDIVGVGGGKKFSDGHHLPTI